MKKEEYNHYYGLGNIFNPFNTGVVNPSTLITISGTIVDEDNQPVPNANVIIEGTAIGTMADFDGRFTLNNVPAVLGRGAVVKIISSSSSIVSSFTTILED